MEGGIKWSPGDVTVDREEYKEIYKDLGGDEESFDDDFEDFDHWVAYCFSKDYGVDYVKQVEFRKRIKDIEVKLREENSEELEEQYIDLLNEYCDFMDESTLKGSG